MDLKLQINDIYNKMEGKFETMSKRYHDLHLSLIDEEEYQSPHINLFIPEWENFYRIIYEFAIGKMKAHGM